MTAAIQRASETAKAAGQEISPEGFIKQFAATSGFTAASVEAMGLAAMREQEEEETRPSFPAAAAAAAATSSFPAVATTTTTAAFHPPPIAPSAVYSGQSMPGPSGGGGGGGGGQLPLWTPHFQPPRQFNTRTNDVLDRFQEMTTQGLVSLPRDPTMPAAETQRRASLYDTNIQDVAKKTLLYFSGEESKGRQTTQKGRKVVSTCGRLGKLKPYNRFRGKGDKVYGYVPHLGRHAGNSHREATNIAGFICNNLPTITNDIQLMRKNAVRLEEQCVERVYAFICDKLGGVDRSHPSVELVAQQVFPRLAELAAERPEKAYAHFTAAEYPELKDEKKKREPLGGASVGGPASLCTIDELASHAAAFLRELMDFLTDFPQFKRATLYDAFQFLPSDVFNQKYLEDGFFQER